METNLLFPVQVETEGGSRIFFVDYANQRVFGLNGPEAIEIADNLKEAILNDLWQQKQVAATEVPTELVREALNIKKDILR